MLTDEMRSVLQALDKDALTSAGVPRVEAIKDAWDDLFPGADPLDLDAAGRDALWAEYKAEADAEAPEEADEEPSPDGHRVTLIRSAANPLKLMVNGKLLAEIREGETATLSDTAYEQLCAAPGVEYSEG